MAHRAARLVSHLLPSSSDVAYYHETGGGDSDDDEPQVRPTGEGLEDGVSEELDVKVEPNPETKEYELKPLQHKLSFDQGFFYTIRAIELLKEKNPNRAILVGVGGPPGAGKSTFANKLEETLDTMTIQVVQFITADKITDGNSEDPELVDFAKLREVLLALKKGVPTSIPNINVSTKTITLKEAVVPKSRIIVLEGSYAIHSALRDTLDISVTLDGGIHYNLLKKIVFHTTGQRTQIAPKESIVQVTNVLFPMYKVFVESMKSDMDNAKIRIHSQYNPMSSLLEPLYVSKARYNVIKTEFDKELAQLPAYSGPIESKTFADMFFYPPKYKDLPNDRDSTIRVRRFEGSYTIYFYNEIVDSSVNVRPVINFEISVKTISGLLSLGYQLGAILNRTSETLYDRDGIVITRDTIKELEQVYIQIKGKNRTELVQLAKKLHLSNNHISHSFLDLYNHKLKKTKKPIAVQ